MFEGYNLLIKNWYYINLPENLFVRYFGYAWAFATISPGIFQTAELVSVLRNPRMRFATEGPNARGRLELRQELLSEGDRRMSTVDRTLVAIGAAMLLWPIVWPSPYLAAPVFRGFIFLLDPICGGLWEFWNFWARAKWIYTVPIFGDIKIFEMPVLGYFGFPPFALECFTMYVFTRRVIWRGRRHWIAV